MSGGSAPTVKQDDKILAGPSARLYVHMMCGRGGIGIHNGLETLSASVETLGVEPLKFGESVQYG